MQTPPLMLYLCISNRCWCDCGLRLSIARASLGSAFALAPQLQCGRSPSPTLPRGGERSWLRFTSLDSRQESAADDERILQNGANKWGGPHHSKHTPTCRALQDERMTSIEIAVVTGKQHKNVMRAIRNMEPAWEKVNGGNFSRVEYKDAKGEMRPCFELTKTECLYIATKFNDEARAKLVLIPIVLSINSAHIADQYLSFCN